MIKGGKLLTAEQSVRFAVLDSMQRQEVIETIVSGLRSAERVCELHKFGGSSPDVLWGLVNGVGPKRA